MDTDEMTLHAYHRLRTLEMSVLSRMLLFCSGLNAFDEATRGPDCLLVGQSMPLFVYHS